jgi:hypothetical protein
MNVAKYSSLVKLIILLLLFGIGIQSIDRRRDDDRMPRASRGRIDMDSMNVTGNPWTTALVTYTSYPLIEESALTDISEGYLNGPEGFAYFADAPARKAGLLPSTLGGKTGWPIDAWASNFQGPVKVIGKSERSQWEWTADGQLQGSGDRRYPFVYGVLSTTNVESLKDVTYEVWEHDEDLWWNPWSRDDYVGAIVISHAECRNQIFQKGLKAGWVPGLRAATIGYIKSLRYSLFCYETEPAQLVESLRTVALPRIPSPNQKERGTSRN